MKLPLLRDFFRRSHRHKKAAEMPSAARADVYRFLLELGEQEAEIARILKLPTVPQLCVIDEEKVFIVRPRDRAGIEQDGLMRQVREATACRRD